MKDKKQLNVLIDSENESKLSTMIHSSPGRGYGMTSYYVNEAISHYYDTVYSTKLIPAREVIYSGSITSTEIKADCIETTGEKKEDV